MYSDFLLTLSYRHDVFVISQAPTLMAVNGDAFSMSAFTGRSNGTNWVEFCEQHASIAAEDFSLHVTQFMQDNVASDRQLTRRDFVNKFVDCFQRQFDSTQVRYLPSYMDSLPLIS